MAGNFSCDDVIKYVVYDEVSILSERSILSEKDNNSVVESEACNVINVPKTDLLMSDVDNKRPISIIPHFSGSEDDVSENEIDFNINSQLLIPIVIQ